MSPLVCLSQVFPLLLQAFCVLLIIPLGVYLTFQVCALSLSASLDVKYALSSAMHSVARSSYFLDLGVICKLAMTCSKALIHHSLLSLDLYPADLAWHLTCASAVLRGSLHLQHEFPNINPIIPAHYFYLAKRCFKALLENNGKVSREAGLHALEISHTLQ